MKNANQKLLSLQNLEVLIISILFVVHCLFIGARQLL